MMGKKFTQDSSKKANFQADHDYLPPTKRLKTFESTDGEASVDASECGSVPQSPRADGPEVSFSEIITGSDSDPESDEHLVARNLPGLESALLPVRTDQEAINQYEDMKASGNIPDNFQSRLDQREWVKGRSSIYVDAFNLALETVLDDETHLFDANEMEVFRHWRSLGYEAQYLYVRLFLRKTSSWHRLSRLGHYNDITDLPKAAEILQSYQFLSQSPVKAQVHPAEPDRLGGTALEASFRFAESSDEMITTFEEATSLLTLDELKVFAKESKVQGKNKSELLKAFRSMSKSQSGLEWVTLKRSHSGQKTVFETDRGDNVDNAASASNRNLYYLRRILDSTGACIRLCLPVLNLFERVHLVFYRSTEWTEKSLTAIILARISRRNFPNYVVSRSANIFESRSELLEFEAALRTQFKVDNILEMNGNPGKVGLEEVLSIFEAVYPRWKVILREEQRKEDQVYQSGEGAYLRRFSPAWVYTRIIHKSMYVLGRFKHYEREHRLASELLEQRLFHTSRRGAWYQRKALLEEHYMYAIQQPSGTSEIDKQKRFWKRIALRTCEAGLQDKDCHLIYHFDLQKRVRKLEKQLKVPLREQHDFRHVSLTKPIEVTVEGIQIKREDPSLTRRPSFHGDEKSRSTRTVWVDESEGGSECSVEAMCLSSYRIRGYKGYHSEGGIVRTLFAYLFYDILFVYIPNVFQTAYQTCPLDLHTDAFYPSRASEINHRLMEISNGNSADIIRGVDAQEREKRTCIIGLNWDFELIDLLEIVECFDSQALALVCKVMAQEYRVRGGGIPDLFLWDIRRKEVIFSEVKSENDKLSDTQRLWIHVLVSAGIKVELCNAIARGVRYIPAE